MTFIPFYRKESRGYSLLSSSNSSNLAFNRSFSVSSLARLRSARRAEKSIATDLISSWLLLINKRAKIAVIKAEITNKTTEKIIKKFKLSNPVC